MVKAEKVRERRNRKIRNRLLHCGVSTLEGDFSHSMENHSYKHGKYVNLLQNVFGKVIEAFKKG